MTNRLHINAALQHFMRRRSLTPVLVASGSKLVQSFDSISRTARSAGIAAPSGRTLFAGGWGCILISLASPVSAFDLPSGQPLEFQESFYERQDDGALWARFRFIMPSIGEEVGYAQVADDFMTLCESYVLPALQGQDMPDQIVVSLADRATEFGKASPEATQFFEAFRPEGASCIWEQF